jgi:transcriptional regulator with XRE-family HTH domain
MQFNIIIYDPKDHFTGSLIARNYLHVSDIRLLLGARIGELRDARKLTRVELAELLGVDARQVASYELSGMWPRPEIASALTKAFQIELRDLYDFTPTRIIPSLSLDEDWLSAFNAIVPRGTAEDNLYADLSDFLNPIQHVRKRQILT